MGRIEGTQCLILPARFPGMTELINAALNQQRTGKSRAWSPYNQLKSEWMDFVYKHCVLCGVKPYDEGPIRFAFTWYEENKRRDPDNFTGGGRKIILDALVNAKILGNDNWKWIGGFEGDDWFVDKENPRVEIVMYPSTMAGIESRINELKKRLKDHESTS